MVPPDAGPVLCGIARGALEQVLRGADVARPSGAWLDEPGAAFVTLTRGGALRGCIGTLQAFRPLRTDVADNAVASATRDPRFPPLPPAHLDSTAIEVSVLSPPVDLEVTSEADALRRLRPHVDGVILTYDRHRGTFLPQVWEQLPEPARFLAHLKRKAGLAADWWDPGVRLQRYTVTAYHEGS